MFADSQSQNSTGDDPDQINQHEHQVHDLPDQFQDGKTEVIFMDDELNEDDSMIPNLPRIYSNIKVTGSASAHFGDVVQRHILQINRLYLSQSSGSRRRHKRTPRKLNVKTDRRRKCVHIEEERQQEECGPSLLTPWQTHRSGDTLIDDIPWDWLSDHVFEDFSCDVSSCVCECHQSRCVTVEGSFGRMTKTKVARYDDGHRCEHDGKIDYIRNIAIWLPKWLAVKRIIQITTNCSTGTWWLPSLPKLIGDQAIFHYASTGNDKALQRLLSGSVQTKGRRFDPNVIRQENGWTPLHVSILSFARNMVTNRESQFALEAGRYDTCHTLISAGARPNMETSCFR